MKRRVKKPVVFIVLALVLIFSYLAVFGVSYQNGDKRQVVIKGAKDIRTGTDISGGVSVTFGPEDGYDASEEQMESAKSVIENRLVNNSITDYELYVDTNKDRIIVRYPWKKDEKDYDPKKAIDELGATYRLTFREGNDVGEDGKPTPGSVTDTNVILEGKDIESAQATVQDGGYVVALKLKESGKQAFADATGKLVASKGSISIWMDDTKLQAPTVSAHITDGSAIISGQKSDEEAKKLASQINGGALPFKLEAISYDGMSATLGANALHAMVLAGIIALILVCVFMIFFYRLPGVIASFALLGQTAGSIAVLSKFFGGTNSFTLTLAGIAGMILSVGMGVDANVITAERIKEELRGGKGVENAVYSGSSHSFWAIFDGNITVIIVAIILISFFGPPHNLFSWISYIFIRWFGTSATGAVYSFGITLLAGVIFNFIMGVGASRLMLKSLSGYKFAKKPWLYGGKR